MAARLEHVGLSVSNLERSISFYVDIMGLELIRVIEADSDSGLGDIVGMPECIARIAHLSSDGAMLELFEYTRPRGSAIPENRIQADNGFIHVGFSSRDARADYRKLIDHGISTIGPPVEFRPGVWVFYFYGPDREVCEVRQT